MIITLMVLFSGPFVFQAFKVACAMFLFAGLSAGSVQASEVCGDMRKLADEAGDGFSNPDMPSLKIETAADRPKTCNLSKGLAGADAYICFWQFDYRSALATTSFEMLKKTLSECLGTDAQAETDQPVNHPDFYNLKTFRTDEATLSISIKDKAALEKTYVFLRAERTSNGQ